MNPSLIQYPKILVIKKCKYIWLLEVCATVICFCTDTQQTYVHTLVSIKLNYSLKVDKESQPLTRQVHQLLVITQFKRNTYICLPIENKTS